MKKSLLLSSAFLSLCLLSIIGNEASALQYDTLYASDRYYLYTIDSTTGIGSQVAPISGFTQLTDIAFLGEQLYVIGYTTGVDLEHFSLFQMDSDTGATTLIGSPGVTISGLTGGPDGYLYGAYKELYKIDPSTGVAILIGSLGNNQTLEGDIDFGLKGVLFFGPNGILYGSFQNGDLATIDISTGTATMIGNIGFAGVINLSFKDGVLYGGTRSRQLLTIDTSTGQGTLVGTDTRVYLGGMTTSPIAAPPDQPPVASCQNVTASAGSSCTASVSIENGSYDPDGDPITLAQSPAGPYPLGNTPAILAVTDSKGASSQCTGTITVVDQTPPAMVMTSVNPSALWPANHKMVDVTVNYSITDNCGQVVCGISSVASNESISSSDYTIVDAHHVKLLAERLGSGIGRIYTISITCTDASGNSSSQPLLVTVPHDQGK
jgi:hypothetical protein